MSFSRILTGFVLLICILITSCDNESIKAEGSGGNIVLIDSLNGVPVSTSSLILAPDKIFILRDKLIIFDKKTDKVFNVFNIYENLEFVNSWGLIGEGAEDTFEYIDRNSMSVFHGELGFLAYPEYHFYNIDDAGVFTKKNSCNLIFVNGDINRMVPLGTDKFIMQPFPFLGIESPEFVVPECGPLPQVVDSIGSFPNADKISFSSLDEIQYFYLKSAAVHPDNGTLMAFYRYLDKVVLYSEGGQLLSENSVSNRKMNEVRGPDRRVYFMEAYSTGNFVYVLYLDKTDFELGQSFSSINTELQVWDWEGELVARFTLDGPIFTFAVDQENNTVYGLQYSEEEPIVRFDLPDLLY
ncbi:MAG: BF3164 family lipoprotein [Lewinella sp.]